MKTNKLTNIIAIPILAGAALLNGCSSDTGFAVDLLKVKVGHQGAIYRKTDERGATDQKVFEEDCEPYDKSEISNGAVKSTSPIWHHYKNRNQEK